MKTPLLKTDLPNLYCRGKVRDTYDLGDNLLIVATDRISAFDVILPNGIPDKGAILTQLSAFWFQETASLVPNHLVELVDDVRILDSYVTLLVCFAFPSYLAGRSMVVKKAKRIEIECVVRGYLAGSGWAEYKSNGTVAGKPMPKGMVENQKLDEPIFTPSTKAETGHDENISIEEMKRLVGGDLTEELMEKSLAIYRYAHEYALSKDIIIADTKMEFGWVDGKVILIDELLTPDSSRFWDLKSYEPGRPQPSFDKQYVRDWLIEVGWNKEPPAPKLPPEVVERTAEKYLEAYRRLTGRHFSD